VIVVDTRGEQADLPAAPKRWALSVGPVTVERARLVKLALDAKWSVAEMATALQVTPRRVRQILAAIREVEADAYLADEWAA
jgi:hypothetical protein